MTNENSSAAQNAETQLLRPRLFFETITFSDGTKLTLDEGDIVVFVGPNNAGKSAALRELEAYLIRSTCGEVIKDASKRKVGTRDDLRAYLEANAQKTDSNGNVLYGGVGYNIYENHLIYFDHETNLYNVANFFFTRLATEGRIQASNAAPALAFFDAPPTHPIHLLLMDPDLSKSISEKFKHAFGMDLTPFRAGGSSFPLYVGKKPDLLHNKDELSKEFIRDLQASNVMLDRQGDGMRSFVAVMLHALIAGTHSVQFLDEPEAFLHPPQARLLGRYIAENRSGNTQLFISTHSTDILDGLIEGGSDKVRIVGLRREGNINYVKELNNHQTKAVSNDTFARFSRVFDGIFFERVIICESDADCMLYQAIFNTMSTYTDRKPDVLFIHASGKHRIAKLVDTLRSLDVPVSVIVDIDIVSEESTFKNLFERLGGNWNDVTNQWKALSNAILTQRPPLNAEQVVRLIKNQIDGVEGTREFPEEKERAIKEVFKTISPWGAIKQSGRSALPAGDTVKNFDALINICSECRLWIVPVGELEGFCRSVGSHGPRFVEKVLEDRDLVNDPELQEARIFIRKIWTNLKI